MNRRQDKAAAGMLAGVQAGHAQARLDKRLAADAGRAREVDMMPLSDVQGRLGGLDAREPTPEALDAMAESLDALGLVEPLAVDKLGRLLAGKTRLLALRRLAAKDPERWRLVPVRRMDFDAEADPGRALAVEVAENEQRRDYTAAEVRALADRLRGAGFKATAGRPRRGEKALLPALGAVVGKSKRQLLRILDPEAEPANNPDPEALAGVEWINACARLRRALVAFDRDGAAIPATQTTAARRAGDEALALGRKLTRALDIVLGRPQQ
jgi:ParB family chromosome partitioning protein